MDYPYYWSSTTHAKMAESKNACHIAFGHRLGYFNDEWLEVHGAGSQRSDPKLESSDDYPTGHGAQGDAIRVSNFVRLVRNM